jgi:hypothetical protein
MNNMLAGNWFLLECEDEKDLKQIAFAIETLFPVEVLVPRDASCGPYLFVRSKNWEALQR